LSYGPISPELGTISGKSWYGNKIGCNGHLTCVSGRGLILHTAGGLCSSKAVGQLRPGSGTPGFIPYDLSINGQ